MAATADGSGQAPRVVVVSIMKSGTHLIQELMVAMGYGMYGQSRITPEIRPVLDNEWQRRVLALVHGAKETERLHTGGDRTFSAAADRAWSALGWAWQLKFGMPLVNRYGGELVDDELVEQARRRAAATDFADTPPQVCWILPEFDIKKIDGRFLREWARTGEPRIIFNYRDPRDALLSMVHFLAGQTKAGVGNFSEFQAYHRILDALPTLQDQLTYALSDPSFPGYGDFERALWLLHHPDVCKVSFEELVGPRGGGTAEAQLAAVARVLEFTGMERSPDAFVEHLYRRDSFSFYKGRIGSWRKAFTSDHDRLFHDRFGDVLSLYGYQ